MNADTASKLARLTTRLSAALMVVVIAGVLFVALKLTFYAFPKADELFRAGRVRDLGVAGSIHLEYTTWCGRWAGTGLSYLLGASFNLERAYAFLLLAGATALPVAIYVLIGSLFGPTLARRNCALGAIAFFVLYWCAMPSTPEGFYWLTGVLENLLPVSATILIVAILLRYERWPLRGRVAVTAGIMAGAATTVAMHELYGLIFAGILAVATMLAFVIRHAGRWAWAAVMLAAVGGLAVVVLAPGNAFRLASEPKNPHDYSFLICAFNVWRSFYLQWLFDPKLLAATALFVVIVRGRTTVPAWLTERPLLWAITIPGLTIVTLIVPIAILAIVNPVIAPGRTQSAIYLIFLVGWFASVFVLVAVRPDPSRAFAGPVRLALTAYLALAFLYTGNLPAGIVDLRGPAQWYNYQVRQRHESIRCAAANGERDIRVAPLEVVPRNFNCFADLVEPQAKRCHNYVNELNAKYFGVDQVALIDRRTKE